MKVVGGALPNNGRCPGAMLVPGVENPATNSENGRGGENFTFFVEGMPSAHSHKAIVTMLQI